MQRHQRKEIHDVTPYTRRRSGSFVVFWVFLTAFLVQSCGSLVAIPGEVMLSFAESAVRG